MKKLLVLPVLLCALSFAQTRSVQRVFELPCPAGSDVLGNAKTYNPLTGLWRAYLCTDSTGHVYYNDAISAAAGPSFNLVHSGTNAGQALHIGNGSTLDATGTGTITATAAPFSGISAGTNAGKALHIGNGSTLDATGTGTITATAAPFSGIAAGTNAGQALHVGNGSTLDATGTGSITATSAGSATTAGTASAAPFGGITADTNTGQALHVGNGSTLDATGTGTITATTAGSAGSATTAGTASAAPFSGITASTNAGQALHVGNGSTLDATGTGTIAANLLGPNPVDTTALGSSQDAYIATWSNSNSKITFSSPTNAARTLEYNPFISWLPLISGGFVTNGMTNTGGETGSTCSSITSTATEPVTRHCTSTSTTNSQGIELSPNGTYNGTYTLGSLGVFSSLRARVKVEESTNVRYWIGVHTVVSGASVSGTTMYHTNTPNEAYIAFRYAAGTDTHWVATSGTATANQTVVDTGVSVDTAASHKFEISYTSGSATFYIDNALVATITTNLPPTSTLLLVIFLNDNEGVAGTVGMDVAKVAYVPNW